MPARMSAKHRNPGPLLRVPLLILGFVGLVVAAGAGLARLDWSLPAPFAAVSTLHGPLMICGFFGVVIALERAVAIGRPWAYLGPLLAGVGGVAAATGAAAIAAWFFIAGSLVLLAASGAILYRQTTLFTLTLALGAACWSMGNALWAAGGTVLAAVPWWFAFLTLTVAGERLELSRFLAPAPGAAWTFAAIMVVIGAGLLGAPRDWSTQVFGAGLLALAAWLFRQDIARRTVRDRGLTRYMAVCLLCGYGWLAAGGAIIVASGGLSPGAPSYDAALHALGLGFVFAMVFAHAPIIVPAVLRVGVPYHPLFYLPLALLQLSLLVRLAGDATGQFAWMRYGGLLNVLALAAFIVGTAGSALRGRRDASP
jgi:hypothetical protein